MKQFKPQNPDFIQNVEQEFVQQDFMKFIGAELSKVEPGFCEIRLPFKKELTQHHGFFHAGIICTLADNTGGFAAISLVAKGRSVLSAELKINLLSSGVGQFLISRGRVVKPGKTLTVCQSEVYIRSNDEEKLCALCQMTLIEVEQKSLM